MSKIKFTVKVTISQYLKQLKKDERQKPLLERRRIPIGREIAEAAGVSLSGYYHWSRNQSDGINRKLTGAAIGLLRHHGFGTTFNDILEFVSAIEKSNDGDIIVVDSLAKKELAEVAKKRMCPDKNITFELDENNA